MADLIKNSRLDCEVVVFKVLLLTLFGTNAHSFSANISLASRMQCGPTRPVVCREKDAAARSASEEIRAGNRQAVDWPPMRSIGLFPLSTRGDPQHNEHTDEQWADSLLQYLLLRAKGLPVLREKEPVLARGVLQYY